VLFYLTSKARIGRVASAALNAEMLTPARCPAARVHVTSTILNAKTVPHTSAAYLPRVLVDSGRRIGRLVKHWWPVIVGGVVVINNAAARGNIESRGSKRWLGRSSRKLGVRALLVRLEPRQAPVASIRGRVGYFCTDRATCATKLHSTESSIVCKLSYVSSGLTPSLDLMMTT
jgi:hypothetical protein